MQTNASAAGAVNGHALSEFLTAAARPDKDSIDGMIPDALHAIRTHLQMEVAFVSEFTEDERRFLYVDSASDDAPIAVGDSGPLTESYCQRVVDGRLPELIPDAWDIPAALELAATRALPVRAHLSVPVRLSDGSVYGTFCCFSTRPDPTLDQRDLAMMRAFAQIAAKQIERRLQVERQRAQAAARIRAVLKTKAFRIVYQPIFHVGEHRVVGFESLTRFTAEPARTPDVWFREADEVGLSTELETAVITKALIAIEHLPPEVYLSLNVSPSTILSGAAAKVLARAALDRIVLEVTEHTVIPDYAEFVAAVAPLRARGLRLAIDDAGAGYASFRHVLNLQPDVIKLDLDLIRGIDTDRRRRALAAALISFADTTGGRVIAEGVETQAELDTLRELRVNKAQGYLLGRPTDLAAAIALLPVPDSAPSP